MTERDLAQTAKSRSTVLRTIRAGRPATAAVGAEIEAGPIIDRRPIGALSIGAAGMSAALASGPATALKTAVSATIANPNRIAFDISPP